MLKTAESVRAGHPDKLADFIAGSILDEALAGDPAAKVAVEVLATKARVLVAGEITSNHKMRIPATVRLALAERGYNPRAFRIRTRIQRQSGDIADGVDYSLEARHGKADDSAVLGAGDQGTVYGYATSETAERLSLPLVYAHRICRGVRPSMTGRRSHWFGCGWENPSHHQLPGRETGEGGVCCGVCPA
ncbi:S-adenosylmethionine synthetase N-terminal domain-containing protein [Dermabacter hominis]|uniref:S-adenosylmethionine synthetase N-terminal domain-containing protein n=1 Tax=Dermabacter hominis TaxID=36740 RepID=UPI001F448F4D